MTIEATRVIPAEGGSQGALRIDVVPGLPFPSERAEQTYLAYLTEALAGAGADVRLFVLGEPTRPLPEAYELDTPPAVVAIRTPAIRGLTLALYVLGVLWHGVRFGRPAYYYVNYPLVAAPLAALRRIGVLRARLVYDVSAYRSFPLGRLHDAMDRFVLRSADAILPRTASMVPFLLRDVPLDTRRILPLHNAVKPALFDGLDARRRRTRAALGVGDDDVVVGYLGNFHFGTYHGGKGVPTLVAVMREVMDRHPESVFLAVGLRERDATHFDGLPADRTRLVARVPHREFLDHVMAADILVIPYPTTYHYAICVSETKLFEYLAAGRAVITTRRPASEEILTDGVDAVLVDYSHAAMRDAIRALVVDPERRRSLGEHGRRTAARHTFAERARRTLDFLRRHATNATL